GTRLGDGALDRLADARLPALASLRLASLTGFGAEGVGHLLRSGTASRLRQLHLGGTGIDDEVALAVATAPGLDNLEDVALEVGDEGLVALMTSRHPRLLCVRLFLSMVSGAGLARLARERCTPGVAFLDLDAALRLRYLLLEDLAGLLAANPRLKVSLVGCAL